MTDGQYHDISHVGYVNARVLHPDGKANDTHRMRIWLVNLESWKWFLVGWNDLYELGATPEQALYATAKQL